MEEITRQDLDKEIKKKIRTVLRDTVKNKMKKNASSVRILEAYSESSLEGVSVTLKSYFFTVGGSIMGPELIRYNSTFKTRKYGTADDAVAKLIEAVSDPTNMVFGRVIKNPSALYPVVCESDWTEPSE